LDISAVNAVAVFLAPKIANLCCGRNLKSGFGRLWVESQSKMKRNTVSALKNDIFGIDRAAVLGRPGTIRDRL
jgi:hypothetical protein